MGENIRGNVRISRNTDCRTERGPESTMVLYWT